MAAGTTPAAGDAAPALVRLRSPLRYLDPATVSAAARAETRNREVHLPPVSTYRWWARRTEAVNGALVDAVAQDWAEPLLVVDPFAGGGVIPLAALIRGHQVYAQDLNPWAATGLAAMLGLPDADSLRDAAAILRQRVSAELDAAYATTMSDGAPGQISHTFRVATSECSACGTHNRMFPHALVSLLVRRERRQPDAYLACRNGHLFLGREDHESDCPTCGSATAPSDVYTDRRYVQCPCGHRERLEARAEAGTWAWEVVLVERTSGRRRELALPAAAEIAAAEHPAWQPRTTLGDIPAGQETRVLLRHGFRHWEDLYPRRQRVLLERLLQAADGCSENPAVVHAVRMAIVGSAEMAGHLSRWDRFYLKSYESMAGHRFNFTTLTVEPNVWGTAVSGRGTVQRRLGQLVKAAEWLHRRVPPTTVTGPTPSASRITTQKEAVRVVQGSSQRLLLPERSAHLVLTDPPYHDDVQYSELSLPLRGWAGLPADALEGEAVVNDATGQLAEAGAYEDLLKDIFAESRRVLREDGHLIFSYANRSPEAWVAVLAALNAAGLRAVGCEILHSENETDNAKRGVRACTLDLIMDLAPAGPLPVRQHGPASVTPGAEADFLRVVADTFLHVGNLPDGWQNRLVAALRGTAFLSA